MANCLYSGSNIPIELPLGQLLIYVKMLTYSISYYKIKVNLLVVINYIFIVPIELPKFERYKEKTDKVLNSWVKFIENPEVVDMKENEKVGKAKKVLEEISQDEHERYLAELREKYIMDKKAIEDAGFDKGLEAGIKQGIEQGIEQGKKQQAIDIAKNLKEQNVDIDIICKTTGLTKEEIENLK